MATHKNFQVKRNKQKNAIGVFDINKNFNKSKDNLTKSERLMEGINCWGAYYRTRPDVFATEYLGIELKPFQQVVLYCMIHYNYSMILASRGLGKTFLTAIYCLVRCILYPGTKIIIASGQKSQAMKIVSEKVPELIGLSKTGMIKREIKGSPRTNMNSEDPNLEFVNGSWIKIVASTQGARSARANLLILDEFRLIEPSIYKNVLRRFLSASRQPGYLNKEKYKGKQEYLERNQEIFLSSCWYKFNWSYDRFKIFLNSMMEGKGYFVCGFPYQVAIKEGFTKKQQLLDEASEDDMDIIGWTMEMDTLFFGESASAFFKTEELTKIRKEYKALYPKPFYDLVKDKKFKYINKVKDEIRILTCDIAAVGGKENDASIFNLIQLKPIYDKDKKLKAYERVVPYCESMVGVHTKLQAIRIRQLYDDLDCDYIVIDRQGNGIGVYDNLCENLYDKERDIEYIAFNSMNDEKMQERCLVENAEKNIYTISATPEFNSDIAYLLKNDIARSKLKLLVDKNESFEYLGKFTQLLNDKSEILVQLQLPYAHTDALINEMVLLESEYKEDGKVKLKEQSGKRKDRYASLAYGNFFANELERKLSKKKTKNSVLDYFIMAKPNIKSNRGFNNNFFNNNYY